MKLEAKRELLDYAIERINEYDATSPTVKVNSGCFYMSGCKGCDLVEKYHKDTWGSGDCNYCPFNITNGKGSYLSLCRYEGWRKETMKQRQDKLIEAVKKWCRKFYPSQTIVRI